MGFPTEDSNLFQGQIGITWVNAKGDKGYGFIRKEERSIALDFNLGLSGTKERAKSDRHMVIYPWSSKASLNVKITVEIVVLFPYSDVKRDCSCSVHGA